MGRLQKGKEFAYILTVIKRQSGDPNSGSPESHEYSWGFPGKIDEQRLCQRLRIMDPEGFNTIDLNY